MNCGSVLSKTAEGEGGDGREVKRGRKRERLLDELETGGPRRRTQSTYHMHLPTGCEMCSKLTCPTRKKLRPFPWYVLDTHTHITSVDHKGVTCYGIRGRGVESRSLMTSVQTRDLSGKDDRSRVNNNTKRVGKSRHVDGGILNEKSFDP